MTLIDSLTFGQPKTREMVAVLKALKLTGSLLVADSRPRRERVQEHPQPSGRVGVAGDGTERLERVASEAIADDHRGVGCFPRENGNSISEILCATACLQAVP